MTRILHISDTHFGTEREPVVQALLRLARDLQPDVVLLSGDITQRARRSQFAAARRFVQALQRPVLAVPGNHDIPLFNLVARCLNPYGAYRRAMGPALEPVLDTPGLLVIGVNSTRPGRRQSGQVDPAQVERVTQRLRKADPQCLKIVMLHHPVRAVEQSDERNLLIGRELAVPAWVDAGVDLILGGHIHLPYVTPALAVAAADTPGLGALSVAADTPDIATREALIDTPVVARTSASADTPDIAAHEALIDAPVVAGPSASADTHDIATHEALIDTPVLAGATASSADGVADAAHRAWVVQAGTAVSRRVRGGIANSVNVIEHRVEQGRHRCEIQRWDFMAQRQAFGVVASQGCAWLRQTR